MPHSEIPGSMPFGGSPRLVAALCVLRRLLMPRHPSCARIRLARNLPRSISIYVVILFNFQLSVFKDRRRPASGRTRTYCIIIPPHRARGYFHFFSDAADGRQDGEDPITARTHSSHSPWFARKIQNENSVRKNPIAFSADGLRRITLIRPSPSAPRASA